MNYPHSLAFALAGLALAPAAWSAPDVPPATPAGSTTAPAPGTPPTSAAANAEVVRLWDGDAPGARGTADADVPTLTVFRPAAGTANGAAFVVCPGGGYGHLAPHEGKPVAQWFNTLGVTGFVLKYRLGPTYHHPAELQDVRRALRLVRARSAEWGLDPNRVGVLGFSAGGHLASTAATHFEPGDDKSADPVDRVSSRPDLAILVYPVITMTDAAVHAGSRKNLLGDRPDAALVDLLSSEKQVTAGTPPTFLVHTADDATVPVENSLMFAAACRKAGVPVELHVYEHGRHGFGLGGTDPELSTWPPAAALWLDRHGFRTPKPATHPTTAP